MAKHLTWCLKRMFYLTNHLNVPQHSMLVRKVTDYAILPKYPQQNKLNIDYDEPKDFNEFLEERKTGKNFVIATLMEILDVTRANAKKATEEYPAFKYLAKKTLYNNFQILREEGVYKSTIKDNKFLLTYPTEELKKKIYYVQMFDIDINNTVHLFHFSISVLANFAKRSKMEASYLPNNNRIQYLAEKLNRDPGEICRLLSYNPHMLTLPAPKLLSITEYLLDAGVSPEHIGNDLYAYNYSISTIKEKLTRAKAFGIKPLKTWVLRCTDQIWERIEKKQYEFEIILPDKTIQEHLCKLFECDLEAVNYVISRDPRLLMMKVEKLIGIAKLLQRHGYKIEDIQRTPLIMHRSYKTLIEYFDMYRQMGVPKPSLFRFMVSKEKFERYLETKRSVCPKAETT